MEETRRLQELQGEREEQLAELELLKEAQKQTRASLQQEEQRRRSQHEELQKTLQKQLLEAQEVHRHSLNIFLLIFSKKGFVIINKYYFYFNSNKKSEQITCI